MIREVEHPSRPRRGLALIAAALILLAQSFAAAHYHQDDPRRGLTHATRIADADTLCAVCIFHFHSPTNPNSPSVAAGGAIVEYRVAVAPVGERAAAFIARPASRAPPISA